MKGFGPALIKGAAADSEKAGSEVGKRFGKALVVGTAAVGAAGLAAGAAFYKVGEVFDDVADTIRVGTGATGKDLDALVDSAKRVGATVPAEFEAIGPVVADVNTRMGLTGETLEKVASQYLHAGNILGEAVDVGKTSAAFNAFNIEGEKVSGALDHLFQVSQATGIGMNELADGVARNAPAVQALGFSFEESAAMIGSFDKAGLNSGAIMASMSKGLVTLAKDGEEPKKAFKRVVGEIEGFIKKGDEAGALNLASKVFGTKGATQFMGALKSGTLNLGEMEKAAGQTGDTIIGAGEDTMDFAEQWMLFKNKILVWLEPMASKVFGLVGDLMADITSGVEGFGAAWGDSSRTITTSGLPGLMEYMGVASRLAFDYITGTAIPGLKAFAGWIVENSRTIGILAGVVTTLMLPVFVRLIVQAALAGAAQVAAWAASGGGAVKAAALYVINSYKMIGAWVAMGLAALKSGAQTAVIWLMYRMDSAKAIAAMVVAKIQIGAQWVAMSAAAVASGIKTAAVWTVQVIGKAIAGAVAFAIQAARVVAGWALMGAQAGIHALKMAAGWTVGVLIPAIAGAIAMGIQAALVVGSWVLMGVQATLQALKMAAAWFIALGPIGWVAGAVIGLVALIIANWTKVKDWTVKAWTAASTAVSSAWSAIVRFGSEAWLKIKAVFDTINTVIRTVLGAAFIWLRDSVIKPVWDSISSVISGVWNNGIKPIFDILMKVVEGDLPGAFEVGKKAIENIWNGIKKIAAKPVDFIVNTVYNKGLKSMFNGISDKLKLPWKLPDVTMPAYAKGGQMGKGWKLVGEEGPELINTGPGHVYTAKQTKQMLDGKSQIPMGALDQGATPIQARKGIGGFWGDVWGGIKSGANSVKDWAVGMIGSAVKGLISPIKAGMAAAMPGAGMNELIRGAGNKLIDDMTGWAVRKDNEAAPSGGDSGSFGGGYSGPLGRFHRPGGRITSGFGTSRGRYPHAGIDFAVPIGTAVKSMFDGVIRKNGWNAVAGRSGKGQVIDHGQGYSSYTGHLSAWTKQPGQKVKAGETTALSGNTGRSTGPHAHRELWKNGKPFNFMSYLHDNGGVLGTGLSVIENRTKKPEYIYNHTQNAALQTLATHARNNLEGTNGVKIQVVAPDKATASEYFGVAKHQLAVISRRGGNRG